MYYQNVRGIRTKINHFNNALISSCVDYDVIILTETWLHSGILNNELELNNKYFIHRCDRSSETSNLLRGGGVLIAVKNTMFSKIINISVKSIEQLFLQIECNNHVYIVGVVYIPPRSHSSYYTKHCQAIEEAMDSNMNTPFYLFGDYNLPDSYWINEELAVRGETSSTSQIDLDILAALNETCGYFNLYQVNGIPNMYGTKLDLVFTNSQNCSVSTSLDPLLTCDTYHPPLLIEISTKNPMNRLLYWGYIPNFKKANYNAIRAYLANIDWKSLEKLCFAETVDVFYSHVSYTVSNYVPLRRSSNASKFPHWFSNELICLIKKKKKAHRVYKMSNSLADYIAFSFLRSQCKILTDLCFRIYTQSVEDSITANAKYFWRYINSNRKDKGLPSVMCLDDQKSVDGFNIANMFADFFSSVYTQNYVPVAKFHENDSVDCAYLKISLSEVFNKINNLNCSTGPGPGPDSISALFLKETAFVISPPLTLLFNYSLSTGYVPDTWKVSYVTPIHKSGDKSNIRNYRPISILNIIPKIFENIIVDKITPLFSNIITEEQHGFTKGRSTCTNLLVYQQYI
ncbi:hypothetical protein PPYR_13740 [Photinus pyralis]|uniref:Endonuclease/exonuclease/phosphatase domain-containing protein n=1 Tax=Photinus pyralis TaxID=7054 RepID=A0A5N4A9X0_PHOPY|nr:hypothetical protein PPYR_13740 [Photinus pyralis]